MSVYGEKRIKGQRERVSLCVREVGKEREIKRGVRFETVKYVLCVCECPNGWVNVSRT